MARLFYHAIDATLFDLVVYAKLLLVASALLVLVLVYRARTPLGQRRVNGLLAVLALSSALAYTNLGLLHSANPLLLESGQPTTYRGYLHTWELFHYYLAPKYWTELGYLDLYGAALRADAEDPEPYFRDVEFARDMQTYAIVPARDLWQDKDFPARFSAERWEEFKRDVGYLKHQYAPRAWKLVLIDHGYNPPPSRTVLVAGLANALGRATDLSIYALALLDLFLLGALVLIIAATYGLRTALLATTLFGLSYLAPFHAVGGSYLRFDWIFLCGVAICSLQRGRHFLAGVLVGVAASMRILPAAFAAGVLIKGVSVLFATRRLERRYLVFGIGLALGVIGPVALSTAFVGVDRWVEFFAKLELHMRGTAQAANSVGLEGLFLVSRLTSSSWVPELVLWLARLAMLVGLVASIRRASDAQAAILGATLVFIFGFVTTYYYAWLMLFCLWSSWQLPPRRSLVVLAMVIFSASSGLLTERLGATPLAIYGETSRLLAIAFALAFAQEGGTSSDRP